MSEIIKAEFHGHQITIVTESNEPYVSAKQVVENIGIGWKSQYEKLVADPERWGMVEITIPSNGGQQKAIGLPLRKLPGWLMTIHPNKIKNPEVKERVISYQRECDDVLWEYWRTKREPKQLPVLPERQTITTITTMEPGKPPRIATCAGDVVIVPLDIYFEYIKEFSERQHAHMMRMKTLTDQMLGSAVAAQAMPG